MTWETVSFSRAFSDVTAKSPRIKQSEFAKSGRYPVRDQGEQDIAGYWDEDSATTKVDRPLILFGDHTRRVKYADNDFVIGADGVKVLLPSAELDPRFAFHWMRSLEIPSAGYSRHFKFLRERTVPLPPLPEQHRIAAILDEADALRVKRSKSVALLDELPPIQFNSRQTTRWPRLTVGDVADLQGGLTVNARRASLPRVAAYLRVANVFRGSIDLSTLKQIGVSDAELSRTRLKRGDVLVVEGHGNLTEVGRAAMVDYLPKEPLTHQNHLFRLRARGGAVTGRFLELAINSPSSREYLKRVANTTSGLNTLNATSVRNLPIRVAPPEEQHEIEAEFAVSAVARSVAQHGQGHLDSLFASLQHRAFRGEL